MSPKARKAVILHAELGAEAGPDDRDVEVQAGEFARVLGGDGYDTPVVKLSLDLGRAAELLRAASPELVVNLVETVDGADSLQYLAPALLEHLELPFTGSPAEPVFICSNKVLAKRVLSAGGVSTPPWGMLDEVRAGTTPGEPPWIVKPTGEHASRGIEADAVVRDAASLRRRAEAADAPKRFVERFVEGREFNVSVLQSDGGPEVLPPAEIDFAGMEEGLPRIVGYRAKWVPDSPEYRHTVRRFDFPEADAGLLRELGAIARRSWELLGLRGYARVDFRVDTAGRPWVLEVNTNPCLSPDAGFAAAAAHAGLTLDDVIRRIVETARHT